MEKQFYVYIMASTENGTLYVGVTSDLLRRVWEHKSKVVDSFTSRYDVGKLVYFEVYQSVESAIRREKRLKSWQRDWKKALIEKENPKWCDLYGQIGGDPLCGIVDPAVKPQDDEIIV